MKILLNHTMNRTVRMLDGQWQGLRLASDGYAYFFGGSHSKGVGAPFFRYDPRVPDESGIEVLALDMSRVCGEDPAKVPTQGKVHSDILEHKGWLYFGTHLSEYTPEGAARYTGAHLVGYELATRKFRDFGVIHPKYTNYSGIGLDAAHGRIYFYTTPWSTGDGPHLHRIDIATGENRDLGMVVPWVNREEHGQHCGFLFVDRRGDCWFTLRGEKALFVAREASGRIERHENALPGDNTQWYCMRPMDGDRAMVVFEDGFHVFDASRFDGTPRAFERFKRIDTPGVTWCYMALDPKRIYWNSRSQHRLPETNQYDVRVYSTSWANPAEQVDHGPIRDAAGRAPWFIGDLASDGKGRLYSCGRWYILPEEEATIGVNRHGLKCAVFFTVMDVSGGI